MGLRAHSGGHDGLRPGAGERPSNRRRRRVAAAAGALTVTGAVVLTALLWPTGDDDSGGAGKGGRTGAAREPAAEPTPTKSYALSETPATLPAVRDHTPARGPGWRPAGKGRVVVGDERLAGEARLLAGELRLRYAGKAEPRAGDVHLGLTAKNGKGDEDAANGKDAEAPANGRGGKDGRSAEDDAAHRESYTLTVKDRTVRIAAPTDAGVFYGTRTLKQEVADGRTAPEGVVRDRPAKPRRGFMIDIARKNFSAEWIEDRIRELGDLKYNEIGLHFSDDQAFRIASDSHPEVVSDDHLSKDRVRRIVGLAASRHITVVPEIDSPGHLGAVIGAHPDLQLRDTRGTATPGAVDISKPKSAKIVDELLREYAELFPGAQWHLGADEYQALVRSDPEASYPQLAAAARARLGPDARIQDLATAWLDDRAKTVGPGREVRAWNDGFFRGGVTGVDDRVEVAYWTGKEIGARDPVEYLRDGRKVVNYNDEYLYYVLGQPNDFTYPTGQRIYEQWTPRVIRGTAPVPASYDRQILGGSFAVWCDLAGAQTQEQVARGIRMPLRATAQKLWDEREPTRPWQEFVRLADRVGQPVG
ncbi:beta-N-acetylhexosaminidase [Streptomyces silvensis]|uniref:beta-N-acetylhexosaminidase n=1 Tax=Streptomyces silvensis TaxID=1765722 RepID=UPI00099E2712|nr:glycoside hydrolase family 20 protein [Streptomyces silvensis]